MVNNKGYTLIEMIMVLALIGLLVYSMIYVPTDVLKRHTEFTIKSQKFNDLSLLRTSIMTDLNLGHLEKIDNETLIIGKSKYIFNSKTIRETDDTSIVLTNSPLTFKLENNILIIYENQSEILKYTTNNSFNRNGGDDIE